MITDELARNIARACQWSRFERYSDPKHGAQRNLSGRTHYADDDTLRFFHARIVGCSPERAGLVLILVESTALDMNNARRAFRFVAFDLFGSVINDRRDPEAGFRTSDKARQAAADWLASFDVLDHYRQAMAKRADVLECEAAALRAGAAAIPAA